MNVGAIAALPAFARVDTGLHRCRLPYFTSSTRMASTTAL